MPRAEKPRSEPEIIPPDHAERRTARGTPRARVFTDAHGTERVYVARLAPLGVILTILATSILAAAMLVLLFATFLIWVPLVILFIVGAIVAGLLRAYNRRAP
jgi:ABC-type transport system involved in cytochrome bd biosynthesis fused ATPase/permease subunit